MKYTQQDFETAVKKLPAEVSVWIIADYQAVLQMKRGRLISDMFAEFELDRLTEEALEEVKALNVKEAGVMLIIKDGLILSISRRHDKTIFGLPGGKRDDSDLSVKDTAIRETREETGVLVKDCILIYKRVEPGDGPNGIDFNAFCYYATSWEGNPHNSEEGEVKWLTAEEVCSTKAAFGAYNKTTIEIFKSMFPNINLK